MKQHRQIVVGIDFSPASRAALQVATRLASNSRGKVTAVHVMEPGKAARLQESHGYTDAELVDHLRDRLRTFVVDSEPCVCRLAIEADVGTPFPTLQAACQRLGADLLVLGTRGTEQGPHQIGALAAASVREAPYDVLLTQEDSTRPFNRVLACIDFSESSAHAVRDARFVAESDSAELECLFVHQPTVTCTLPSETHLPLPNFVANGETTTSAKSRLDRFVTPLLPAKSRVQWQTVVSERPTVQGGIFERVAARDVDLVVLGSRPTQGMRAFTAGSTAEEIIGHAGCSVLTVRPPH